MHTITDQIKLLMAKKKYHQIGEMRGKIGEKLNKGKKQMREKLFWGKNQISYLISSSYCYLRYLSLHQ